jgi:hypothetical protein
MIDTFYHSMPWFGDVLVGEERERRVERFKDLKE